SGADRQSSRSERQHKAWGASPRIESSKRSSPRSGRCFGLSPAPRAQFVFRSTSLGLAPQALCCRSLRELYLPFAHFAGFICLSLTSRALSAFRSLRELWLPCATSQNNTQLNFRP